MTGKNVSIPEPTKADWGHAAVKAAISAIPFGIGGPAAELFQQAVQAPLEKRRKEWMEAVGERLQKLESAGLKIDELQQNEAFISAVMHASHLALRNHQKVKLEALRNAILNVATGQAPDETLQHLFLGYVDALTELHLRILWLFHAPRTTSMSTGGLINAIEQNIPDLRGHQPLTRQLWADLESRGLLTGNLNVTMSAQGLGAKLTTAFGDSFLDFITEPN